MSLSGVGRGTNFPELVATFFQKLKLAEAILGLYYLDNRAFMEVG